MIERKLKEIAEGKSSDLLLIAGPCQIESLDHALQSAEALRSLAEKYPVTLIYKSSFDKANRTSINGKRGVGIDEGLAILEQVRKETGLPVITDIHAPEQAQTVAAIVDVLQIPAFLCRQTDLLIAAGQTGKPVNVKKGQFLHPQDMQHVAEKISSTGNTSIFLCERGTCFGYRDLIVDPRSFVMLSELGYPVVFDATHSVQSMGGAAGQSGGSRQYIPALLRSAVAVGIQGIFIECHEQPERAPSDGASMVPLDWMEPLMKMATELHRVRRDLTADNVPF